MEENTVCMSRNMKEMIIKIALRLNFSIPVSLIKIRRSASLTITQNRVEQSLIGSV